MKKRSDYPVMHPLKFKAVLGEAMFNQVTGGAYE